ncbi:MAG: glucosamine-6-phosphate deaminase [Firmicutes bacterium]|nr:glucosamine-6-phosphate deaminase [Bacillota bacterium]
MKWVVYPDYDAMSRAAAAVIAAQVRSKPNSVLGLATGSTPVGTYQELVRMHKEEDLDFSQVVTYNLDEYLGLPAENQQSYHYFMWQNLFGSINIKPSHVHIPPGQPADVSKACQDHDRSIEEAGGIDLQLLGIGRNGHIGFNEPDFYLRTETHLVALSEDTIAANARFFDDPAEVPRAAVTMGVGTIMKARHILLLASGEDKAEIVARMVEGPVTTEVPASVLQMHPQVTVLLDQNAARVLQDDELRRRRQPD